eukprot:350505-Chlamydomonas_euryale.AAC.3
MGLALGRSWWMPALDTCLGCAAWVVKTHLKVNVDEHHEFPRCNSISMTTHFVSSTSRRNRFDKKKAVDKREAPECRRRRYAGLLRKMASLFAVVNMHVTWRLDQAGIWQMCCKAVGWSATILAAPTMPDTPICKNDKMEGARRTSGNNARPSCWLRACRVGQLGTKWRDGGKYKKPSL